MKIVILFYLLFELFFCETVPKWKLETKSLDYDGNIELHQGKYSKIFFVLTSLEEDPFSSELNYSYKLAFKDDNIAFFDKEMILNPKEKQAYSTYIGLNCNNSITEDTYIIKISVTSNNDETDELSIQYSDINVTINREKIDFGLELLFNSMPKNSFNLFKIYDEIYNVDEINIIASEIEDFEFKEIIFEPYGKRGEIKNAEGSNHGILFDFPFYKKSSDEKLQSTNYEFTLSFKNSKLEQCYELPSTFSFSIGEEMPSVDDNLKKEILKYNLKDVTSEFEITNGFSLKLLIPPSPILIQCSVQGQSFFPEYNSNINVIYRNFKIDEEIFNLQVENLEYNSEYFVNCELSDTNFISKERKKINITIGNNYNYDIIHQLNTSRESVRTPHCIKFTFQSKEKLLEFKKIGLPLCKYIMKKNEPLYIVDLPTIACDIIDENEIATICVGPSAKNNIEGYTLYDEIYNYDNQFKELIKYVKDNYNAKEGEIYNDTDINNEVISVAMTNKLINPEKDTKFYFEVLSNHTQEIQCYYNKKLSNEGNKFLTEEAASIILSPNEKKSIEVGIVSSLSDYKIYSLNFKCFNLPKFYYKYKSTEYMTMYSYLYIKDKEINQESKFTEIANITKNCKEKKSQKNPLCLKINIIPINKIIKTELPKAVLLTEAKVDQFSKLTVEAKNVYLKYLVDNFKKELISLESDNIKKYFQLTIEILKYLASIDCSQYYNFSDTSKEENESFKDKNYLECRKIKKEGMKEIFSGISLDSHLLKEMKSLLNQIGAKNLDESLKYILIFAKELSNNADSYIKECNEYMIDFSIRLQEQFKDYWPFVEEQLNSNYISQEYIEQLKKDTLLNILEILTNIPRILHFQEIDEDESFKGKEKDMTKTGLIKKEELIKVQNAILNFSKNFKDYELKESYEINDLSFNLSGYAFIGKYQDINTKTTRKIYIDEEIIIDIQLEYLLKYYKASYLQILVFDSPLVTLDPLEKFRASEPFSDTLNIFISIQLLNEEGEEISVKNISNSYKPKIFYLKNIYNFLQGCYYYNETNQLLEKDGINIENDAKIGNKNYFKCTSDHLTLFTAGTKDLIDGKLEFKIVDEGKGRSTMLILLVSLGIVILLTIIIYFIVECSKRKRLKSNNIDSIDKNNERLIKEELY